MAPTDLFYPGPVAAKAPRIAPREAMPPNRLPSYLVKQRRLYQRGLLAWLRGDEAGREGDARRDRRHRGRRRTQPSLRAFWWTVGALLEAVTEHGVETGFGVKQLAARIDLQIRRVAEGGAKVADRLRREVLYYVAISAPVGPQVQAVQRAFKLSGLIPTAEALDDRRRAPPAAAARGARAARRREGRVAQVRRRAARRTCRSSRQTLASVHTQGRRR